MVEFLPPIIRSNSMSTLISPEGDRIFTGHQNGHFIEWSLSSSSGEIAATKHVPDAHGPVCIEDKTYQEQISSDMHDMRLKVDIGARNKTASALCSISAMTLVISEQGDRIFTGGVDGAVCCWDAPGKTQAGWAEGGERLSTPYKATIRRHSSKSPVRRSVSSKEKSSQGRGKSSPSSRSPSNESSVTHSAMSGLPSMTLLTELGQHKGPVAALATIQTPNNEIFVASAGVDALVKVWNVDRNCLKQTLRGHTDRVWCLGNAQSCDFFLSGGLDNTIRVYEVTKNGLNHVKTLKGHKAPVKTIKVCNLPLQHKHVAVSGSEDCSVRIYSLCEHISLLTSFELSLPVSTLSAIPALGGGMFVVVGNDDGFSHGGLEVWGVGQLAPNDVSKGASSVSFVEKEEACCLGSLTNSGLRPFNSESCLAKNPSFSKSEKRIGAESAVVALATQNYCQDTGNGSEVKTTVVACDRAGHVRVWRDIDWTVLTKPSSPDSSSSNLIENLDAEFAEASSESHSTMTCADDVNESSNSSSIKAQESTGETGQECSDDELVVEGWTKLVTGEVQCWVVVGEPELSQLSRPRIGTLAELRKTRDENLAQKAAKVLKKQKKAGEVARMKAEETRILTEKQARLERIATEKEERLKKAEEIVENEERLKAERIAVENEGLKAERIAAECLKAERIAAVNEERLQAERIAAENEERLKAERIAAECLKAERIAAVNEERLKAERIAAECLKAERISAENEERLKAERISAENEERLKAERLKKAEKESRREAKKEIHSKTKEAEARRIVESEVRLKAQKEAQEAIVKEARSKANEIARTPFIILFVGVAVYGVLYLVSR